MNREEMLIKLKRGEDPLDLAIEKWEDILYNEGVDYQSENCALCATHEDCDDCPLYALDVCSYGFYRQWKEHQKQHHAEWEDYMLYCNACRYYAKRVLNVLIDLKYKNK
jgi:hypothetical protein